MSLEEEVKSILLKHFTFTDSEYSSDLELMGCGDIFDAVEAVSALSIKYKLDFPDDFLVNSNGNLYLTPGKIISYLHSKTDFRK